MYTKRVLNPILVERIWDGIKCSTEPAEVSRVIKYLQNFDECTPQQAEAYIKHCLRDKLIVSTSKTKNVEANTVLKLPVQELPELDGNDWYCFECHLAGTVKACRNCYRVYHTNCVRNGQDRFEAFKKTNNYDVKNVIESKSEINQEHDVNISLESKETEEKNKKKSIEEQTKFLEEKKNYVYNEALCSVCNISNTDTGSGVDTMEMNYLLKFVLHRIRSWLPTTITHTMAKEDRPEWLTDEQLTWRANQLFYNHKDMSVIEVKLNTDTYKELWQFYADVLTVQHNVSIFHGIDSQEYGATELMVRDTLHDLSELKNCVDCYRHSNEKINQKWFCLPCRNPHTLVWAKQKGYPYWPAKILRDTGTHYDVRFFGGKYERALLVKSLIKPITLTKESLGLKMTSAFNKAYEELQFHKKLLIDPKELELFKASSKVRRRTMSKQRGSSATSPDNRSPKVLKRKHTRDSPVESKKTKELGESSVSSNNVIDISDGEESTEYSFRENHFNADPYVFDEHMEQVSSSTENYRHAEVNSNLENGMHRLDQPYSDSVEKMRRKLETTDPKDMIKCAMDCMQEEIDKLKNEHNEHLKRLFESHNAQISETKKKQWCYNCEQDAIYHCCWNTAYCSQTCQQQHWQAEHKKVCRRKRTDTKE